MSCNATLTVYRNDDPNPMHVMECWHKAGHVTKHTCGGLHWEDTIPGAKPHRDPEPETDSETHWRRAAEMWKHSYTNAAHRENQLFVALDRERERRQQYERALEGIATGAERLAGGERASLLDVIHEYGAYARRALEDTP